MTGFVACLHLRQETQRVPHREVALLQRAPELRYAIDATVQLEVRLRRPEQPTLHIRLLRQPYATLYKSELKVRQVRYRQTIVPEQLQLARTHQPTNGRGSQVVHVASVTNHYDSQPWNVRFDVAQPESHQKKLVPERLPAIGNHTQNQL